MMKIWPRFESGRVSMAVWKYFYVYSGSEILLYLLKSEHFPFLGVNNVQTPIINMHCRTTFYTALGRLLMVELGEDEEKFERFMLPLRG